MRKSALILGLFFVFLPSKVQGETLDVIVTPIVHGTIPKGAQRVPVLKLTFTSQARELSTGLTLSDPELAEGESKGGAPIEIFSIDVQREGQGSNADIERVYLMEGVRRISRGVSLSRDGNATLRPRRFSLGSKQVRNLTVTADFSASAATAGTHRFLIETIETSAGIKRGLASLTEPGIAVSPESRGNLTVTFLDVPGTAHALALSTLAKIRIEAGAGYDHILRSITLRNEGTARGRDLRDLALYMRGRKVTDEAVSLSGKDVTLLFTEEVRIASGKNMLFELKGRPWTRIRTAQFTLEEPSDLSAGAIRGRK